VRNAFVTLGLHIDPSAHTSIDMATTTKKTTLTLSKTASNHGGETTRRITTRAKQAARRDGRDLPVPKLRSGAPISVAPPPAEANVTSPPRVRSTKPAPGRPADARRARTETTGAPKPRAVVREFPVEGEGRRRPRTTDDVAPTARLRRHDSKSRQSATTRAPGAPGVNTVVTPPREPDGTIRVSKLLSEQGLCSRREADSYIARGWVFADGVRVTELGTRVLPTAKLSLDQNAAAMQDQRATILLNKPIGYVSGQAEDGYQPASVLVLPENQVDDDSERFRHEHRRGLAPAGRLDIDSTGLLVLTQDGRIAKQLVGENSEIEKEYLVRVEGKLADGDLERLRHGLELDGEALKPAKVRWQNAEQLNFILREGKKRQIRRMCEMVGLKVIGLKRIRIGRVMLGDLPMGKWRFLRDDEAF
jgi:23S rRNA pseudouridine2604 synthase